MYNIFFLLFKKNLLASKVRYKDHRVINDLFVSLELDKDEWLKDIVDGSSSLKAFLALAGESISERESKRFEEGLNTKVKLTLLRQ